jgi:microcompartment protein CcmK/EutM
MRILLRVCFDRRCHATIGVPLAKDRVDGTPQDCGVDFLNFSLGIILGFRGVKWHVVSFAAKFGNALNQLWNAGRDIGELNNVGIRSFAKVTKVRKVIGNALVFPQYLRKGGKDATSHGDIARDDVNAGLGSKLVVTGSSSSRDDVVGRNEKVLSVRRHRLHDN